MQKILIKFLFIVIFAPIAVYANANEQEASSDSTTVIKVDEYKGMFLSAVSWPFVNVIQPAAEFLMYPIIPPLIYVSRENLIEKGQKLITYGDSGQITFYPLVNAKTGSQASIGFIYRHAELISENDYISFSPHLYINADWDFAASYRKSRIMESSFFMDLGARYKEIGSNSFIDPYTTTYFFADSSLSIFSSAGFRLIDDWDLSFTLETNFHRLDLPNLEEDIFIDDPDVLNRGFYQNFNSFPLRLSMFFNTTDVPYAATRGSKFNVSYSYVPVTHYNNSGGHNYHVIDSRHVSYLLLGKKSYAMTVAESEANRERLKNLTFKEALDIFNPMNVKEEILDRRVLVTQIKARYMIEENKGKAPFTAMGNIGESFPLRAYSNGFNAPIVAGFSTEYRWPIDIYADALIFNEYGVYGYDLKGALLSNLKNSYGLGFRVRAPNLFIARFALAFHGLHGIAFILTTRPEYN